MAIATASDNTMRAAAAHLSQADPVMALLVRQHGLCTIRPHTDYYRQLVRSIIGQQLSVKAAASINQRFVDLFSGTVPEPELILKKSHEELRTAGLSNAKARYITDLATHVIDGKLQFDMFDVLPNEEIIRELTAVKGIGEWTAHMFLMFSLGRLNVLPVGDLGIKTGIMRLYAFQELPTTSEIAELAKKNIWHPYESVASWYLWRSLDNEPIAE